MFSGYSLQYLESLLLECAQPLRRFSFFDDLIAGRREDTRKSSSDGRRILAKSEIDFGYRWAETKV